jgi:hypothetical protein
LTSVRCRDLLNWVSSVYPPFIGISKNWARRAQEAQANREELLRMTKMANVTPRLTCMKLVTNVYDEEAASVTSWTVAK